MDLIYYTTQTSIKADFEYIVRKVVDPKIRTIQGITLTQSMEIRDGFLNTDFHLGLSIC